MKIKNKQQLAIHSKRVGSFSPIKTLGQSDSSVVRGTLVWGKLSDWPWWPGKYKLIFQHQMIALLISHCVYLNIGVVVSHNDVGWPISKKKETYCILWLGPNKSASLV